MKICVTAKGNSLESEVDPRFGRCSYFILVESESGGFEAVENPYKDAAGGAGIQAGQFAASKGIEAVLTGNVGPNAFETLSSAGIGIFTGVSGTVKDAVEKYKKGGFRNVNNPTVNSKHGMNKNR